mmetsp:Transcript_132785/g.297105  ORF Transcript_132785/g.297105 Transcript_132785/m.297105 type:complete len:409 (-) Transcript_132785:48-1274(-)
MPLRRPITGGQRQGQPGMPPQPPESRWQPDDPMMPLRRPITGGLRDPLDTSLDAPYHHMSHGPKRVSSLPSLHEAPTVQSGPSYEQTLPWQESSSSKAVPAQRHLPEVASAHSAQQPMQQQLPWQESFSSNAGPSQKRLPEMPQVHDTYTSSAASPVRDPGVPLGSQGCRESTKFAPQALPESAPVLTAAAPKQDRDLMRTTELADPRTTVEPHQQHYPTSAGNTPGHSEQQSFHKDAGSKPQSPLPGVGPPTPQTVEQSAGQGHIHGLVDAQSDNFIDPAASVELCYSRSGVSAQPSGSGQDAAAAAHSSSPPKSLPSSPPRQWPTSPPRQASPLSNARLMREARLPLNEPRPRSPMRRKAHCLSCPMLPSLERMHQLRAPLGGSALALSSEAPRGEGVAPLASRCT